MPGGVTNSGLRNMFKYTPMPVSMDELRANLGVNGELAFRMIHSAGRNQIIEDEGKYWLAPELMDEGILNCEAEIEKLRVCVKYLRAQKRSYRRRFKL